MRRKKGTTNQKKKVSLPEVQVACKESNHPEDTEPEKSASHQPERQDILSDPVNGLPDEKEQKVPPEIVVSNLGPNAGWLAGTKALLRKKVRDGCLHKGNIKTITDKIKKRFESLEDKGSLLSNEESTFNDLERKVGEDGTKEVENQNLMKSRR